MKEIAKSLVKAQKAFGPALKSATNPHFRSKYADLSACVEAVIDALNGAGIALVQHSHECEDGVIVETVFVHESGETYSAGKLHVPASKKDPQGYGSALTYARRYSLMAACGIAPEDDDGNAASRPVAKTAANDSKAPKTNGNFRPAVNVVGKTPYKMKEGCEARPDRLEHVVGVAGKVLDWVNQKRFGDAVLEFDNADLEIEEKQFVWSFLDSTQRRSIKDEDEAQRTKYANQQPGSQA